MIQLRKNIRDMQTTLIPGFSVPVFTFLLLTADAEPRQPNKQSVVEKPEIPEIWTLLMVSPSAQSRLDLTETHVHLYWYMNPIITPYQNCNRCLFADPVIWNIFEPFRLRSALLYGLLVMRSRTRLNAENYMCCIQQPAVTNAWDFDLITDLHSELKLVHETLMLSDSFQSWTTFSHRCAHTLLLCGRCAPGTLSEKTDLKQNYWSIKFKRIKHTWQEVKFVGQKRGHAAKSILYSELCKWHTWSRLSVDYR